MSNQNDQSPVQNKSSKKITMDLNEYETDLLNSEIRGANSIVSIVRDIVRTGGQNLTFQESANPSLVEFINEVKAGLVAANPASKKTKSKKQPKDSE